MPLELFAVLVPAGIAIIVLIVRFWGLSHAATLTDIAHVQKIFLTDFEDIHPNDDCIICDDNRAAFLNLEIGKSIGLVEVMGDRYITRVLSDRDIREVSCDKAPNMIINYSDFTHPSGGYKFATDDDFKTVAQWIKALKEVK